TSADWMERNLNRRIEVGVQIEDPEIKTELQNLFNLYLKDTVKSRIINRKQNNSLKKGAAFNIQDYLQNEYYNSESN
ncbi:MAG: polyphosphate kinase 1, partial [Fluviicola sp.]